MSACPTRQELQLLLNDQLSGKVEPAVLSHIDGCPGCQAALETLTAAVPGPQGLEPTAVPDRQPAGDQHGQPADQPGDAFWQRLRTATPSQAAALMEKWQRTAAFGQDGERANGDGALLELPDLPRRLGQYEILRQLGRGGMAVVYLARQVTLNRLVALKVILGGVHASPEVQERFRSEAESVARLKHPHIVQIYEIGHHEGLWYLALEYVEGGTLAARLDANPLPPRESGRLLELLARAIHYAHQHGIIHRDLKPANILIGSRLSAIGDRLETETEARADQPKAESRWPIADPKIADFGLAKQLEKEDGQTQTGVAIGTPSYMAPEQAAGRSQAVTAATDVYALGAILYELLTGRPPFMGTTAHSTLEQVLTQEPVPPHRLQPHAPRDLETICLKCLQKEPQRRYASALELADDLHDFQEGRPIQARPISWLEQVLKWARRRPAIAALSAACVVLLVAGTTVSTALMVRALGAERKAVASREMAEERFQLASEAVETYLNAITKDPELKDRQDLNRLRKYLLETAVPFYQKLAEQRPGDPAQELARGRAYLRLGTLRAEMGDIAAARADFEQMRDIFARLVVEFPDVPDYRRDLGVSYHNLARQFKSEGNLVAARSAQGQALKIHQQLAADFPEVAQYRFDLGQTLTSWGSLLEHLGERTAARQAHEQALQIRQRLADDFPLGPVYWQHLATSHNYLGVLLRDLGEQTAARAAFERALQIRQGLAATYPTVPAYRHELAESQHNLAVVLGDLGDRRGERIAREQALKVQQQLVADFPTVPAYRQGLASMHNHLGVLLKNLGDRPAARAALEQALRIQQQLVDDYPAVPGNRYELAKMQNHQGVLLKDLGELAAARAALEQALKIQQQLAADFPTVPDYRVELGGFCCNYGNFLRTGVQQAASLEWYDKAQKNLEAVLEQDHRHARARDFLRNVHMGRAQALYDLNRHAEALPDWDRAVELSPPAQQSGLRAGRAVSLIRTGNTAKAVAEVEALTGDPKVGRPALYNAACVLSVASAAKPAPTDAAGREASSRYADQALTLLRRAAARGYFQDAARIDHLKKDPDLDALRSREDFRQFVGEQEAASPKK